MAFSINNVTLLGRCAQDPELRYTANGTPVCTLNIATSRSYREGDEWKEVPEFTRCVVWAKAAEYISQNVTKGNYIYVDGRLQTRKWQDKEGQDRYTTEVVVRNFVIPKAKGEGIASLPQSAKTEEPTGETVPPEKEIDDMPF